MSFDLYLLPLKREDDFDAAMEVFDRMESGDAGVEAVPTNVLAAADVLRKMDPRYAAFALDHEMIAQSMGISVDEARVQFNYIEMNGPEDLHPPLAQFTFHPNRVVVHWYDGTAEEELFGFLRAISSQTALSLVDPQGGKVYRLGPTGEFE